MADSTQQKKGLYTVLAIMGIAIILWTLPIAWEKVFISSKEYITAPTTIKIVEHVSPANIAPVSRLIDMNRPSLTIKNVKDVAGHNQPHLFILFPQSTERFIVTTRKAWRGTNSSVEKIFVGLNSRIEIVMDHPTDRNEVTIRLEDEHREAKTVLTAEVVHDGNGNFSLWNLSYQ